MIKVYVYEKSSGLFKRIDTGLPQHVTDDLTENEDFTLVEPPTIAKVWRWGGAEWLKNTEPLEDRQAAAWEAIKRKRYDVAVAGVYVSSVNKVFHTDDVSVIQYNNIGNMIALNTYEPIQWKVKDNTWLTLTVPLFKELQAAMVARTNEAYQVAEHHKAEMLKAEDPELYDFTTGWPDDPETEIAAP